MDITLLIIVLVVLLAAGGVAVVYVTMGSSGQDKDARKTQAAVSDSLRALVQTQRKQQSSGSEVDKSGKKNLALAAAAEGEATRRMSTSAQQTLPRRLRYARWHISAMQFRAIQIAMTVVCFIPAYRYGNFPIKALTVLLVPNILHSMLEYAINKRFKAFDKDYPALLMQYVSLLKTGMSTIAGLEQAAKGMDHDSILRAEVELLIERLRLGLTEEQAINAFAEDIRHPELELFIQSLILSKRVGGQLSATLERLARQVRKRQQFREEAIAAVGLERNSMYAIGGIMTMLLFYIAFAQPELILPAFSHPTGLNVILWSLSFIVLGFWWSRKVTNIKI